MEKFYRGLGKLVWWTGIIAFVCLGIVPKSYKDGPYTVDRCNYINHSALFLWQDLAVKDSNGRIYCREQCTRNHREFQKGDTVYLEHRYVFWIIPLPAMWVED